MKIDGADNTIVKLLRDGRRAFKMIADEPSVTGDTVRARGKDS